MARASSTRSSQPPASVSAAFTTPQALRSELRLRMLVLSMAKRRRRWSGGPRFSRCCMTWLPYGCCETPRPSARIASTRPCTCSRLHRSSNLLMMRHPNLLFAAVATPPSAISSTMNCSDCGLTVRMHFWTTWFVFFAKGPVKASQMCPRSSIARATFSSSDRAAPKAACTSRHPAASWEQLHTRPAMLFPARPGTPAAAEMAPWLRSCCARASAHRALAMLITRFVGRPARTVWP
mmetsp:Transcript_92369/g.238441  ORF Transcript_92369/g.238441 Transcript_92369/m.238441 type:complete len:236 (-) Transcript_92369:340-1047(-)